jgi:hypothetical protein
MSAVDLQYSDNLASAIDDYSTLAMNSGIASSVYKNIIYNTTNFYGTSTPRAIDLKMYMENIVSSPAISSIAVQTAAQNVSNLIYTDNGVADDFVISSLNGTGITANGISLTPSNSYYYKLLDFAANTDWNEYCQYLGY